jgi:carbon-monoxide dehydrogenase medium subunit
VKPAEFRYEAPATLAEALALLERHGEDAKLLAGGQSLVPMMSFRLARPEVLIDLNGVAGLDGIAVEGGELRVGGLVRHATLERGVVADPVGTLLAEAARHVGHLPIRERGTLGGSLAHADPAAEWCLVATTLDAQLVLASTRGDRTVAADDFFASTFVTTIAADEIIREVRLPLLGPDARVAFQEFSRREGDFAMVAVAVVLVVEGGTIRAARIGLGGVAGRAVRAREAEAALAGRVPGPDTFAAAAALAARHTNPSADIHGSAEYRRKVVEVLTRRALDDAGRDEWMSHAA